MNPTMNGHALKVKLVENDTKFQNAHPVKVQLEGGGKPTIEIVDELPETGKPGEVYWLRKDESGSEDVYDLYEYIDGEWCKIDVDIKLYSEEGQGIDGAMTQKATSDALDTRVNILTTADYNYPDSGPKTGIKADRLAPGLYKAGEDIAVYLASITAQTLLQGSTLCIMAKTAQSGSGLFAYYESNGQFHYVFNGNDQFRVLARGDIVNNLTYSATPGYVLDATQGKVLNDKFGGMQLVQLTQAQYDALTTKDPNTLYIIKAN